MTDYSPLFLSACTAFEEAEWDYEVVPEQEVILAGFEAYHTRVQLHVQVFVELGAVSVVSESFRTSPNLAYRTRIAELAMRINQTLTIGNFEMEWDKGRLVYRVTNLFPTPEGDPGIMRFLIHNTIGEMDRITPLEAIILDTEIQKLPGLDLEELIRRDDLLPEIPASETSS